MKQSQVSQVSSTEPQVIQNPSSYLMDHLRYEIYLLKRFQSVLDINALFHVLVEELKKPLGLISAKYDCPIFSHNFASGELQYHQHIIRLSFENKSLGTLTLSRNNEFSSTTLDTIETTLELFKPSLFNALKYTEALVRSLTCPLTKLKNRLAFDEALCREVEFGKRHHTELSIILLDIDNFKLINDSYGHVVGDKILIGVAQILLKSKRHTDMIFRFGGEEFSILLNHTPRAGVFKTAERLRKSIENHLFECDGHRLKITISLGISHYHSESSESHFFEKADRALYLAKKSGRNQTVEYKD
ncbi:MAG: GGDEF domain-containing protein [Gammaproteobacteria bacterium]